MMHKFISIYLLFVLISCSPKYLNVYTTTYSTSIGKIFTKKGDVIIYYRVFRDNRTGKITSKHEKLTIEKEVVDINIPKLYITDKVAERYKDKDLVMDRSFILMLPKNYKMEEKNEVF